jgi:hypothetical protein
MAVTHRDRIIYVGAIALIKKINRKYWYPFVTRRLDADDVVFLNFGYEEDPPMGLPLAASDEPNRFCVQLYYRTATQADITGKQVLEISWRSNENKQELRAEAEARIVIKYDKYTTTFPDFFEMGSSMAGGGKMRDAA